MNVTFCKQHAFFRSVSYPPPYLHVVKDDLRVVPHVPKHLESANHADTRCVFGDDQHRLLPVPRTLRGRAPEEDEHLALWAHAATDVPLVAVDEVVVAVAKDRAEVKGATTRFQCKMSGYSVKVPGYSVKVPCFSVNGEGARMQGEGALAMPEYSV